MTATRAQLKQRVRDYMATYSGIGTDVTEAASVAVFPAYEVQLYGLQTRRSGKRNVRTYNVRVFIYTSEMPDATDSVKLFAAKDAAEDYIDPLAEFVADNPTLYLASGSPQVFLASGDLIVSCAGVGELYINKKQFFGFALDFSVTIG